MDFKDEFISQVLTTIDEAEVLTIFFPNLAKALVIDTRRNFEENTMVRVVNQVNSMEERMAAIEKMRPQFGRVRSIAGIPWSKSIRTLNENGIISRVEKRLTDSGESYERANEACMTAFHKLQDIENTQWIELIKGHNPLYKTIWDMAERA